MLRRVPISCLAVCASLVVVGANADGPSQGVSPPRPEVQAALDRISADALRGHLSFLASDLLEGRGTPSRGLDLAAEFIASQFRGAGLEPIGDDGYFQTANWRVREPSADGFTADVHAGGEVLHLRVEQISLRSLRAIDLRSVPMFKIDARNPAAPDALRPGELRGKAVVIEQPDLRRMEPEGRDKAFSALLELQERLAAEHPALVVSIARGSSSGSRLGTARLLGPDDRDDVEREQRRQARPLMLTAHDSTFAKLFDALPPGQTQATISLHMAAPVERPVKLRNVIGLLRGSDPQLRDTYVLVSAHYDHLGMQPELEGDCIYNGANDDGSGTVSVIELASALATLQPRPRRSLVFLTFFGEEMGLLGSRYYAQHPVVPIEQTVADVNIEQVGRTDGEDGPQLATASITGIDYSSIGPTLQAAGRHLGIKVYKHERFSDGYFRASDNYAFAELGIPAHSICVTYKFPDYHKVGDHWEKVDFANMARVDRMIGLGLLTIANDPERPTWDEANPKAARYARAAKERAGPDR